MKQPSTRRLFSYKLIKTACAGCKKSRKAQRHETAFRLAKSSSASKHQEPQSVNTMKQPSTRRLFSYKLIKTACAGCKKSRKAQRHETAFRLAKSSSASKHQEPQSVNTMKQPSTRRLFSYKLVKTACAGCKKSRKAQRHETMFRLAKSSSASKHHGCQRRGKTVSASLSRPRSRQRRLRARRPQYQQYHGASRRVLPYRHGRVVLGHRIVRFFENLVLYGLRQFRSRRVQRFIQNAIGLCVLSVFGCY